MYGIGVNNSAVDRPNTCRDVNGLKKKKKEIHDKTMKFENYATLTSVAYCLSLLQRLLIAGCIIFLLS